MAFSKLSAEYRVYDISFIFFEIAVTSGRSRRSLPMLRLTHGCISRKGPDPPHHSAHVDFLPPLNFAGRAAIRCFPLLRLIPPLAVLRSSCGPRFGAALPAAVSSLDLFSEPLRTHHVDVYRTPFFSSRFFSKAMPPICKRPSEIYFCSF